MSSVAFLVQLLSKYKLSCNLSLCHVQIGGPHFSFSSPYSLAALDVPQQKSHHWDGGGSLRVEQPGVRQSQRLGTTCLIVGGYDMKRPAREQLYPPRLF